MPPVSVFKIYIFPPSTMKISLLFPVSPSYPLIFTLVLNKKSYFIPTIKKLYFWVSVADPDQEKNRIQIWNLREQNIDQNHQKIRLNFLKDTNTRSDD